MHAVDVRDVIKTYQSGDTRLTVLAGVNLVVRRGEFLALRGPSGSGKTTLLNLLAGLDTPTSGAITVLDTRIDQLGERRRTRFRAEHIGVVFQETHLIPGLSALENVILARLPWERRSRLEPRARTLLERLFMGHRLQHPPSQLSVGERQRVGVARALLGGHELLLADEPTGNLDAVSTAELLRLLRNLQRELDLTVIVATHDDLVSSQASRVVRLADGVLAGADAA